VDGVTSSGGCGWSYQLRGVWVEVTSLLRSQMRSEEPDEERGGSVKGEGEEEFYFICFKFSILEFGWKF